jgi:large repetitive protein
VVVTVIQPMDLKVSDDDSICIGTSTQLLAGGADRYEWSPAAGLSATDVSNPLAAPGLTTNYRVIGYDQHNCFTDTAYVLVAVGNQPKVSLGPDHVLSTGTLYSLKPVVQNGPVKKWVWSPAEDLNCSDCPNPVAAIKRDATYTLTVITSYNCTASDTISIKTFCESSQVFVPNAFTPDGDGINDIMMVRAKGIAMVKTFRIYNRWGEVVFERNNFSPNNPAYGWDGKIKGKIGGPDVYIYTAEVICENGTAYTYRGNISLLK